MSSDPAKLVLKLPPGYHFVPTDVELIVHYLRPRLDNANHRLPLPIFITERIIDYHPDILIEKYRNYGEGRWFFFTVRQPKKPGGNRPNRTTPDNGHWNATGSIKPIRSAGGVLVGCRRTLVFYEASRSKKKKNQAGLPPAADEEEGDGGREAAKAKDGVKTDWTMNEYESLTSEAEFEAICSGNAHKMGELVLCTIQKKKHSQEGGETKKSTKRKTKEEEAAVSATAAGDVEQGSPAVGTTEGQDEDNVRRALMEAAAVAEAQAELAYHAPAAPVVDNFNVDPDQNMPYCYLINSLSSLVPTPPQKTLMAPASASADNHTVMYQQNNYYINIKNSQSFHAQATPPPQEFLPYLDTKMAAASPDPPPGGFVDMLQNGFADMTPSPEAPLQVPGTGMYLSPRRSKSDVWERLKSEDAWWSSHSCPAMLSWGELNSPYGYNHTAMHQPNYLNHSMNTRNSQFHVQATREEFLPYLSANMAAPLGGGNIIVDHHMLQNRIVNMTPDAEAHTFIGYGPGLANSNYGHGAGDYGHLSTAVMDHPGPSRFSFPSQQSQGPILNNQVSLDRQNSAPSMEGYDQRNYMDLAPKDRVR